MKKIIVFLAFQFIASCAMGPIYSPAPPPTNDFGLIYLIRGYVEYGGGYRTPFSINGHQFVELFDYGYSTVLLESGTYTVGAENLKKTIVLNPGQTIYLMFDQDIESFGQFVRHTNRFREYDRGKIIDTLQNCRYKESRKL